MNLLFSRKFPVQPEVTVVLLDWSVRESFHSLDYLANQNISRDSYEIVWVEYYDRIVKKIEQSSADFNNKTREYPLVDKWLVMNMPEDVYYHKHLMYNAGIIISEGKVVVFCDSDALFTPSFIPTIIKSFNQNPNIVLHLDELRNINPQFYPFNAPSFAEIRNTQCVNHANGTTTGLLDTIDPIHSRNYGACMCARRKDLIKIGGADEHIDYLGHICGPYEMTFRLMNSGSKLLWHEEELLYHLIHPGQDGAGNYFGPHDGYHMSSTALQSIRSGRVKPLLENRAINKLREKKEAPSLSDLLIELNWDEINIKKLKSATVIFWPGFYFNKRNHKFKNLNFIIKYYLAIFIILGKNLTWRFFSEIKGITGYKQKSKFVKRIGSFRKYLSLLCQKIIYLTEISYHSLAELEKKEIKEVSLYGRSDSLILLWAFRSLISIKIKGLYGKSIKYWGMGIVSDISKLNEYRGHVLIINSKNIKEKIKILKDLNIPESHISLLEFGVYNRKTNYLFE